jgi:uncharacterized membrane protein
VVPRESFGRVPLLALKHSEIMHAAAHRSRLMTLSPHLKSQLAAACYTLGLAIAVYLALLKLFALPCIGPGSCQAILYSRYGSVFQIPVGVFGAALWLAIVLVPTKEKRDLLLVIMAVGTAVFMIIQFLVLRGFCLYCTLHAVAAWGALSLHHQRPRVWMAVLALALAGGGFSLSRQQVVTHAQTEAARAPILSVLADDPAALSWLGPVWPRSPALVLSLDCAACLDLLDQLTRESFVGRTAGPAVFLKTNPANRDLTVEVMAAVLSQHGLPQREAFLAVLTVLLAEKEATLAGPEAAAARLAAIFPASAGEKLTAEKIVAAQSKTLGAAGLGDTTPLLISRDGRGQAFFKSTELFP